LSCLDVAGRVVATLEPAGGFDERPWKRLRNTARWHTDPTAPALAENDINALK